LRVLPVEQCSGGLHRDRRDLVVGGEVGDDVCEGPVKGALAVEGTLELKKGAVTLVGDLLAQRKRFLAAHRVVSGEK
jgi:glutamate synthase domain-containing protein 3